MFEQIKAADWNIIRNGTADKIYKMGQIIQEHFFFIIIAAVPDQRFDIADHRAVSFVKNGFYRYKRNLFHSYCILLFGEINSEQNGIFLSDPASVRIAVRRVGQITQTISYSCFAKVYIWVKNVLMVTDDHINPGARCIFCYPARVGIGHQIMLSSAMQQEDYIFCAGAAGIADVGGKLIQIRFDDGIKLGIGIAISCKLKPSEEARHKILEDAVGTYGDQPIKKLLQFLINTRSGNKQGKYEKAINIWKEDMDFLSKM